MSSVPADELTEPGSLDWWSAHADRLRRRRPRAGGLTVEQIVDAAVALADDQGWDAVTVRDLAGSLGTSSATLYRHVASVEELRVLVIDRVLGEISLPAPDLPGRERVVALSWELRRVLLAHPGVVPALRAAALFGPNARRAASSGLDNLLDMGLPREVAVRGYLAMIDYVLGSVYFDSAAAADGVHRPGLGTTSPDDVFGHALDAFLEGLVRHAGSRADASADR